MNRIDKMNNGGEAELVYGDVKLPVAYVICAVTGAKIELDDLRYWNVDLQEAYATPEASLKRHQEKHLVK